MADTLTKAPSHIESHRLILRRPTAADAQAIFTNYSNDSTVTPYLGWPRHTTLEHTKAFLAFSDTHWARWPAGPYLIETRTTNAVVGSTGFTFETPVRASIGYVLSREVWGNGYATEALAAITALAPRIGIRRLYALTHAEHRVSSRVLEKCGYDLEGRLRNHAEFPNLGNQRLSDVLCFARIFTDN